MPCAMAIQGFRYKGFNNMTKENLQNAPQNTTASLVESNNNQTSPQMLQQSPKPSLLRLEQYIEKKDYEFACRELMVILEKWMLILEAFTILNLTHPLSWHIYPKITHLFCHSSR